MVTKQGEEGVGFGFFPSGCSLRRKARRIAPKTKVVAHGLFPLAAVALVEKKIDGLVDSFEAARDVGTFREFHESS